MHQVDFGPIFDLLKSRQIVLFPENNNEWSLNSYPPHEAFTPETLKEWWNDRESFLARTFNKPLQFVRWWLNWRGEDYPCQAVTSKRVPCKNKCWYGDTSLENFVPDYTEFCTEHQNPDNAPRTFISIAPN